MINTVAGESAQKLQPAEESNRQRMVDFLAHMAVKDGI
ncbi:MAG: hypothetical protein JWM57_2850, partial [Phycisphaerales bacterium]|nr:hypothetical protein [Phycisphaerales bacterium]